MRHTPLQLHGVVKLEHDLHRDARGSFMETWNSQTLTDCGINAVFVQDNMSSSRRWALRGLHYQVERPQGKLLRVVTGSIFDVLVDLRRHSPTFGRSLTVQLSAAVPESLWIPSGFAHGFLSLADDTRVAYKVTDYWVPEFERTLLWNDPALGIDWPLPAGVAPLLSAKDALGSPLATADCYV